MPAITPAVISNSVTLTPTGERGIGTIRASATARQGNWKLRAHGGQPH